MFTPTSEEVFIFPLSFAQERLWFLYQLDPKNTSYNISSALQLDGQLNIAALERAIQEIQQRHEVLRTTFKVIDGVPFQVIAFAATLSLPILKLDQMAPEEQFAWVECQITEEARKPFDLSTDSLLRVNLLKLAEHSHVLQITVHHIIADVWSIGIFIQELTALYEAFCQRKLSPLPELPIQYADFAQWQRQWLSGEVLESQLNYWKQQLAGAPALLELPTDRNRPAVQTGRGSSETFELSAELTQQIKHLSQLSGSTLFMTLLAAFSLLLSRYSHQEDIVVGSVIANRNRQEIEPVIGFFVNTLVLRTNLEGNPSFGELLQRVRQMTLDAYAHQDLPFEQLVEVLQPKRSLSHHPLFQVMFVLQNAPIKTLELPGLTLKPLEQKRSIAKFDLTLTMQEIESKLVGTWEYNSDLFEAQTVHRMMGHFQTLCQAIANNPEQPVSQLPLLTEVERHQLLVEWNQTAADYPQDKCIHQLFEEQVERSPDSVAVVFEDCTLTYRELNSRANQLAHYLQTLGVEAEVLVGICVERSLEMVIGLLGILKAGGAYVPLEPEYPLERLAFILQDTQVPILLTEQHLIKNLPQHQTRVVCLDTDWEDIATQSQQNLMSECTTQDLAYIIYTSGSTGQPKGVLVNHSNVVRLFAATQTWYNFNQQDVFSLFHSIAFDFSVWELWGALVHGGRLVIVPYWLSRSPEDFYKLLSQQQVTVLNQTPSAFRQLIQVEESLETANQLSLRLVIFGGEALELQSLRPWFERHGDQFPQLVNMYGITETTVHVTYRPLTMADLEMASKSFIGRPIPDLQVYLLDQYGQPVPIGVKGEMYIGGAGVAQGYLNRPELTAQRFIPNSFSEKPNARLYKSGDLARYLPNKDIEYLGRIDHQVKIRGFRIELGEIEAVLGEHPHVREVVVIVHEDVLSNKRLVAYLVAKEQSEPSISEIRHFLKQKLPEYMVPSAFVLLEALPLTPNGKVDRQALSAPESELGQNEDLVAPRTPTEEIIANIFASVLGLQQVGIYNNFFELGGHSLLATQVISRLREAFQVEIPLRTLFEAPTVAELDQALCALRQTASGLVVANIKPFARNTEPLPLSWAQERLWFLDQLEGSNSTYNIFAALEITGQFNIVALEIALSELVRRHEVLRTTFVTVNGTAVQAIAPPTPMTIPVIDLGLTNASEARSLPTVEQTTQVKRLVTEEAERPFDLATGPLLRVTILQLGENSYVLLVTMHHIISDGWSIEIFIQELSTLYQTSSPLPELPIQYADFAQWQRQWLSGEVLDSQLNYWKQQLAGAPALLELPTDRNRPAVQTGRGSSETFELSAELTQQIKHLSQLSGSTLFMTLLAAFSLLLSRYSHQEDIVVGSPIANRNRQEIEPVIGFFVNTLVLRTNLEGNPSFRQLLQRVRQMTLDAYAHQDLPFEHLVEVLQPERSLSHHPLFQVMFALQNAPIKTLELPGLTLKPLEQKRSIAKFDLTLTMQEIESKLVGTWEYNSDLFEADTIRRMMGHFQTLCSAIANNPEQPVSQLPLLSASERHHLLVEWNQTSADYPQDKCIHQLFEEQVEHTPDNIAVVYEQQQLTYRELNTRANQLAHHLQKLGVAPDVLVGICVERSLEMVVGLLGILKAGGAYVPIDPMYPKEWIALLLEDSQPPVLLTQRRLLEILPKYQGQTICLDADYEIIAQNSQVNPVSNVKIENLAYVIYTSGSTGKPKGVMLTHRAICNHMLWMQTDFPLTETDKVLQKTPFSFDASAWEFYLPLLAGAQLVMARPGGHQDSDRLIQTIVEQKITTLQLVPTLLRMLLENDKFANCQSLRNVFCGGEPLTVELQERFFAHLNAELHNLYGPTETCIDATYWTCKRGLNQQIVPIGRPIANAQAYILDKQLQLIPVGAIGELHIGGAGLGKGYLNRPELTAQKFILNPHSKKAARLYKTGDLARYLPNGEIEYVGRIDHQVKIRGFRIELGEVEALLSQHPAVRETVVVVRSDSADSQRLVAYVVPHTKQTLTITELRNFLESKLPNYMVPQAFVMLEALPLTPNGKVDRKALPAPERIRPELEKAFIEPQTTVEKQLAAIWTQVLGLEKIGINDNFFELGGDSILSLQIISKANLAGLHLTPKQLFQHQTIAQLAAVAGTTKSIQAEQGAVTGLLPLTPIQHWFFAQQQPDPHHWNQAVLLEVKQTIDPVVLEQVVRSLQKHHDVLRLRFIPQEFGTQGIFASFDDVVPITHSDLSTLPKEEQAAAITAIATKLQASLNLSTKPLFQIALFDLGSDEPNRLFWVIHHLVVDGVSWRILIEDFQTVYWQLCQGKTIQLPPKTTSFQQWSHCLQEYANSSLELRSELDYWLTTAGQTVKPIPRDFSHGDNTQATACQVSVSLGVEETQVLLQQVPAVYQTQINDILLTALTQTFAQWTGENSLLLDLEGHGREELFEDVDLSRTVGWFTSIFPVNLSLENPKVPGKALMAIKEQLRAIPNRGIGYGVLHYLSKEEEITEQLSSLPQAEVIFNYLGQFDQVLPESSLFSLAQESIGSAQSLNSKRSHLLEINSSITQGRLQVKWTYSEKLHRQTTVEALAHGFIEALRSLIAHCQSPNAGSFTPSDFAEFEQSQWNQADLDAITQAIEGM
ncbi:amino acid adenylation domain-containing protein [Plectonema radiosum NIES-515]|uniref:Amino acid adenylation domain-containing protein n=1 Tax=Plectonema radiosum NIES-515 TaxID=2986073 RepID=A0ABT3AS94_9CYAN|nr:non-ribosomal peptide synthetase [Plectonema radiosum]MCV3211987.1 amino acid adenylation domain-containing protein [Plectonema radiosum NIES-515]